MAVKTKFDQSAAAPVDKKKKRNRKLWWSGGGFLLFCLAIYALYKPQATIHYGVCKVYLELNEPYPQKMKYLAMEDFGQMVRVIYRKIDSFGLVSVNVAECTFKIENNRVTPYLLSVDINGKYKTYRAEEPARIEAFNKSVPVIEQNPPDLSIPYFPLNDMSRYRSLYDSEN